MPTVLRIGAFRFFFYSNENAEPAHIHIQRDAALAKIWLSPVSLASSTGFNAADLNTLLRLTRENSEYLLGKWNDFFGI